MHRLTDSQKMALKLVKKSCRDASKTEVFYRPQLEAENHNCVKDISNRPELAAAGVIKVLLTSTKQLQQNSFLDIHVLIDARSQR